MNAMIVTAGVIGVVVSGIGLFICIELTIAYWHPRLARRRWREFVAMPKLEFFAPAFRWMMPLFAIVMLAQVFVSGQILLDGLGVTA